MYIITLLQLVIRHRSNNWSAPRDLIKNAVKRIPRMYHDNLPHVWGRYSYNKYLRIIILN